MQEQNQSTNAGRHQGTELKFSDISRPTWGSVIMAEVLENRLRFAKSVRGQHQLQDFFGSLFNYKNWSRQPKKVYFRDANPFRPEGKPGEGDFIAAEDYIKTCKFAIHSYDYDWEEGKVPENVTRAIKICDNFYEPFEK